MKILLTGGTGLLGKELLKIDTSIIAPTHSELDITNIDNVRDQFEWLRPNVVIHAAALLDSKLVKQCPEEIINTNIIGTSNIAIICIKYGIRLCFISTDYVYPGTQGFYKESDPILPYDFYAWSKVGGEAAVQGVKNHLIIRTSFGPSKFPYSHAFRDKWRSKMYVEDIAPEILVAATSLLQGVINIGGSRKTVYEYAKERNPDILPMKERHSGFHLPHDTSLNLTKWKNYKNGKL